MNFGRMIDIAGFGVYLGVYNVSCYKIISQKERRWFVLDHMLYYLLPALAP